MKELNEFSFFRIHRINDHVYIVRESFGYDEKLPNSYFFIGVVVGNERVAVIDSGNGATGGLRRYIEQNVPGTAGKPMICLLSHNHLDHIGGSMLFDERYLHTDDFNEEEFAWATNLDRHFMSDYSDLAAFCQSDPDILAYCRENYYKPRATPADCKPLNDGDIIDIGGVEIVVYHTPGHTRGSCSYYLPADHIAFVGDSIPASGLRLSPVLVDGESETLHNLKRVKREWAPDSLICGGHHMIWGMDLVDKLLDAFDEIQSGSNLQKDTVSSGSPFKYQKKSSNRRTAEPGVFGMNHFHKDIQVSYSAKVR